MESKDGGHEAHATAANSENESQTPASVGLAQGEVAEFCKNELIFQNASGDTQNRPVGDT